MSTQKRTRAAKPIDLSIGQVAKETGLTTATINFYVTQGVLPPPRKINRTRAAYDARHVRLLQLIRRLQAAGLSLQYIKGALDKWGRDEAGLRKLEGIGYFKPLPRPRNDPDREPIEHFDPVDRATFLALCKVSPRLLDRAESLGLLRPKHGRYDARDLWLVRNLLSLATDGLDTEACALEDHLVGLAQALAPLIAKLAAKHSDDLRDRTLRVTDLYAPFLAILGYLTDRMVDERFPTWRAHFWPTTDA